MVMKTKIVRNFMARGGRWLHNHHRIEAAALTVLLFGTFAQRVGAQPFPPQGDDVTPSMGVFRIVVDPLFRPLLTPTGPPLYFASRVSMIF